MKKIITSVAILAICTTAAYAQDSAKSKSSAKKTEVVSKEKMENDSPEAMERKEKREERMKNMTPEQREHAMERREKFKSLPPEKQQAAKAEMKRHREEMKKITGEDIGEHHGEHHGHKDGAK